mgnify:FL=1
MISVIIPTVQKKLKILKNLLEILTKDSCVDEILVINNKPDVELNYYYIPKVKICTPERNLYVNASWNLGISLIKNDNFVLMNDDMLVCDDYCKKVVSSEIFNDSNTGLIGCSNLFIKNVGDVEILEQPVEDSNNPMYFERLDKYLYTGDWGISIFGKKENYYTIPNDIKIIYGDNYLLYSNIKNQKYNYKICNLPVNHVHSASCKNPEFSSVVCDDIDNAKNFFQ